MANLSEKQIKEKIEKLESKREKLEGQVEDIDDEIDDLESQLPISVKTRGDPVVFGRF